MACNVIIVIHLNVIQHLYSCPISMLMVVVAKFIYQNGVIHAVKVGLPRYKQIGIEEKSGRKIVQY